jgi:ectoine hydroxylase-related dioxygenase (phytanoyl-CoA dioxygenase family)
MEGVLRVPGLISPHWIKKLRHAMEWVRTHPGPQARHVTTARGAFLYDNFLWTRHAPFLALHQRTNLAATAATLMSSKATYLLADIAFIKDAGCDLVVPWHQDKPYSWFAGSHGISVWIPLDSATIDTGTVEYVCGSHEWNRIFQPITFGSELPLTAYGFEKLPDIERSRAIFDIRHFDCRPGDVIFHHPLTLHSSPPNHSARRTRRALAIRYVGDDARYAPTRWSSPPFAPSKPPGSTFGCELSPQVWPAA